MGMSQQDNREQSKTTARKQYCYICGQTLEPEYQTCPCCGESLPAESCPRCGAPRSWFANYCSNCGCSFRER